MTPDLLPRNFARKIVVDQARGCWIFTGCLNSRGYGCIAIDGDGSTRLAHRAAYELLVDRIPAGMTIDHFVCFDKRCCNPAHLEVVTRSENSKRAFRTGLAGVPEQAKRNAAKTHCPQGHPYSGDNLLVSKRGERFCRTCRRGSDRRRRQRTLALIEAGVVTR